MSAFGKAMRALAGLSVLLLVACQRHDLASLPPQVAARPVAPAASRQPVPDTRAMGAGAVAANCGIRAMPQEMLQRINAARAAGHRCGLRSMGPARPLRWDASLYAAAAGHSLDMARRNYFEHESPDGSTVSQRASASRYDWKSVGENIAGGDRSVDDAVQGWLASPEHCENIMDPDFRDVAVACVSQPGTQWGTYWTMMLGRRR